METKLLKRITAGLLLLVLSYPMMAQNTVEFSYNEKTQELTIKPKCLFGIKYTDTVQVLANKIAMADSAGIHFFTHNYDKGAHLPKDEIKILRGFTISNIPVTDTSEIKTLKLYVVDGFDITDEPVKIITLQQNEPPVDNAEMQEKNSKKNGEGLFVYLAIGLVVVICSVLFVLRAVKKRRRNNGASGEVAVPKSSTSTAEEDNGGGGGLSHVYSNRNDYFELDMQQVYGDTAVHKIFIHWKVVKETYDFFKEFLESADKTCETGCFFVGCWEHIPGEKMTYNISVEEIVRPGDDIVPDEFSFDFGYEINRSMRSIIRNLSAKTGREYVHTVWMHSHPDIGLFLSAQDLAVQDLLKSINEPGRLVAFVIDTNSPKWDFAVFTTKKNGEMNNRDDMRGKFSMDDLYAWSREAHMASLSHDKDTYFSVFEREGDGKKNVCLNGKTINELEKLLYQASSQGVVAGFFSGRLDNNNNLVVEKCDNVQGDDKVGVFIVDDETPYEMLFAKYNEVTNSCLLVMVYRSDQEIWIASREDINGQFPAKNEIATVSLQTLKEWMRRKRVYR